MHPKELIKSISSHRHNPLEERVVKLEAEVAELKKLVSSTASTKEEPKQEEQPKQEEPEPEEPKQEKRGRKPKAK